ncbi:hypothetical protein K493DRAFT_225434 [Basidiobolus meristosporus CBS 931.73]|uniref:Inositolphosphotransferase Aur1/Ipt1 domain-containing protein n=1 Tax=Basidiobolus meristosporus CBS 931.73 TaxID=1314790 RepID=A0A1Y1Y3F7_9FUNG|nr:hypothetical protein K493DRAFT_225434 [Basidiobolus meristosporus CBS 931.73]|eukprot:ORX92523.1 hypothetical protein K493DRAFT_225434 [Basidiobolus meristosporus CBS 931.73]
MPLTTSGKLNFLKYTVEGVILGASTIPFFTWGTLHWALKLLIGLLVVGILLFTPKARRVVYPALPVLAWLVLFTSCGEIPTALRPEINVTILPRLEAAIFGRNLSDELASNTSPAKDILAWIPYGILHFINGIIAIPIIYYSGSKGTLHRFVRAYGYMNLAGVITQIAFPTSSPWYLYFFGTQPANYAMPGNPGGLIRVDSILHINLYSSTFSNSPLVFGAWPSLHSGSAILINLFIARINPWLIPLNVGYVVWIWWACLYLRHHYLVDLIGGLMFAAVAFIWAYHDQLLPDNNHGKQYQSLPNSILGLEHDLNDRYPVYCTKEEKPLMVVIRT